MSSFAWQRAAHPGHPGRRTRRLHPHAARPAAAAGELPRRAAGDSRYKHIVALAEGRFYADATRCIEYGPVAAFFARHADLDPELSEYFAGFQQIVSYLYDPDGIFEANLRRAGAKNILYAFRKLDDSDHAAHQLARPLEQLALYLEDAAARVHPAEEDRAAAAAFLGDAAARPLIAIHPGSGSPKKNWPIANWLELAHRLSAAQPEARLVLIGGEADEAQLADFLSQMDRPPPLLARSLPLPELAAILEQCRLYLGHDTASRTSPPRWERRACCSSDRPTRMSGDRRMHR